MARSSSGLLDALNELIQMASQASTGRELSDVAGSFASAIGFDRFALARNIHDPTWIGVPDLSNWPAEFVKAYVADSARRMDPTLAAIARGEDHSVWDASQFRSEREKKPALFRVMQDVGVKSGFVVALPQALLPGGVFSLTSSRKSSAGREAIEAARLAGQVCLIRLNRLEGHSCSGRALRALTVRQRSVLAWAAQGKSNRDIAAIIGLSERTVVHHMSEILRRLGCSTRTQAVAIFVGTRQSDPFTDHRR